MKHALKNVQTLFQTLLFPREQLRLTPAELDVVMDYQRRLGNLRVRQTDSEASAPNKMMFVSSTPGHYTGYGLHVASNRHLSEI